MQGRQQIDSGSVHQCSLRAQPLNSAMWHEIHCSTYNFSLSACSSICLLYNIYIFFILWWCLPHNYLDFLTKHFPLWYVCFYYKMRFKTGNLSWVYWFSFFFNQRVEWKKKKLIGSHFNTMMCDAGMLCSLPLCCCILTGGPSRLIRPASIEKTVTKIYQRSSGSCWTGQLCTGVLFPCTQNW